MTEREHRKQRKNWRRNQRNKRTKDQTLLKAVQNTISPPNSPDDALPEVQQANNGRKKWEEKK